MTEKLRWGLSLAQKAQRMSIEQKLSTMNLSLPEAPKPVASYVPAARTGNLVYSSGQLPFEAGELRYRGRVGSEISRDDAHTAARIAALNALAAIKSIIGELESITRIVRVTGYVNSAETFSDQSMVMNGASDLLLELFGEAGRHTRVAIGVSQLPLNACVEVDIITEVDGRG
jgi:enamine deaminase RidA (YjgF/YER057c/UK114 family)